MSRPGLHSCEAVVPIVRAMAEVDPKTLRGGPDWPHVWAAALQIASEEFTSAELDLAEVAATYRVPVGFAVMSIQALALLCLRVGVYASILEDQYESATSERATPDELRERALTLLADLAVPREAST